MEGVALGDGGQQVAAPQKSKEELRADYERDYMKPYMHDRREADRAGFGGSKDPRHPKYNPNFMTVTQWRAHKAAQAQAADAA